MNIINNIKDTGVKASELDVGTVFRFDGDFYLVTKNILDDEIMYVCLNDFSSAPDYDWICSDKNVQVVKATLTLDNY